MKKIIRLIVTAAVIIIVVLLFNTLTLSTKQVTSESLEKVSLPNDIFQNLSKGIRYPTISLSENAIPDSTAFLVFIVFLKKLFH